MTDDSLRLEVQIAELRSGTERGLEAINQRLDDFRDEQARRDDDNRAEQASRHVDNVKRLEKIDAEVRRTNGRVTRLETKGERSTGRDGDAGRDGRDGRDAREPITLPTLKWWLVIIGSTAAATWGFMQLIGFHR